MKKLSKLVRKGRDVSDDERFLCLSPEDQATVLASGDYDSNSGDYDYSDYDNGSSESNLTTGNHHHYGHSRSHSSAAEASAADEEGSSFAQIQSAAPYFAVAAALCIVVVAISRPQAWPITYERGEEAFPGERVQLLKSSDQFDGVGDDAL